MSTWTRDELEAIGDAEELELASMRRDGTLRRPVTIWDVRIGDDIYVRSVSGRGSSWFRGVQDRHRARIEAGGVEKDVALIEIDVWSTSSTPPTASSTAATPGRPRGSQARKPAAPRCGSCPA